MGENLDENKVVELCDATLMMNARSRVRGTRWVSCSDDAGNTWSTPRSVPELPDPACNGHIATVSDGRECGDEVLFSNAADPLERRRGTLRWSPDGGRTWPGSVVFAPGSASYSVVQMLPDGHAGILYESDGEIRWLRLPLSLVRQRVPGGA